jgi:hypothetical protein
LKEKWRDGIWVWKVSEVPFNLCLKNEMQITFLVCLRKNKNGDDTSICPVKQKKVQVFRH